MLLENRVSRGLPVYQLMIRFCYRILLGSTATLDLEKRALSAISLIGVRVRTNIQFEKKYHLSINYPVSNTVQHIHACLSV